MEQEIVLLSHGSTCDMRVNKFSLVVGYTASLPLPPRSQTLPTSSTSQPLPRPDGMARSPAAQPRPPRRLMCQSRRPRCRIRRRQQVIHQIQDTCLILYLIQCMILVMQFYFRSFSRMVAAIYEFL